MKFLASVTILLATMVVPIHAATSKKAKNSKKAKKGAATGGDNLEVINLTYKQPMAPVFWMSHYCDIEEAEKLFTFGSPASGC